MKNINFMSDELINDIFLPGDDELAEYAISEEMTAKLLKSMGERRKEIEEIHQEKQEKKAAHKSVAIRAAVIAAVISLMILIIPSSRQVVVSAAESAWNWFTSWTGFFDDIHLYLPESEKYKDYSFKVNQKQTNDVCEMTLAHAVVADDMIIIGLSNDFIDESLPEEYDYQFYWFDEDLYEPKREDYDENCDFEGILSRAPHKIMPEYIVGQITDSDGNSVDFIKCSTEIKTDIASDNEVIDNDSQNKTVIKYYVICTDSLIQNLNHDFSSYSLSFDVLQYCIDLKELNISYGNYHRQPYASFANEKLFGQSPVSKLSFKTKVQNTKLLEQTSIYDISQTRQLTNGVTYHYNTISYNPVYTNLQTEITADEEWKIRNSYGFGGTDLTYKRKKLFSPYIYINTIDGIGDIGYFSDSACQSNNKTLYNGHLERLDDGYDYSISSSEYLATYEFDSGAFSYIDYNSEDDEFDWDKNIVSCDFLKNESKDSFLLCDKHKYKSEFDCEEYYILKIKKKIY